MLLIMKFKCASSNNSTQLLKNYSPLTPIFLTTIRYRYYEEQRSVTYPEFVSTKVIFIKTAPKGTDKVCTCTRCFFIRHPKSNLRVRFHIYFVNFTLKVPYRFQNIPSRD